MRKKQRRNGEIYGSSSNSGSDASSSSKKYTVGICQLVEHETLDEATRGFKEALTEKLSEGNVEFNEQNAQGEATNCSTITTGFVSSNVDLIMANATRTLQAATQATNIFSINHLYTEK